MPYRSCIVRRSASARSSTGGTSTGVSTRAAGSGSGSGSGIAGNRAVVNRSIRRHWAGEPAPSIHPSRASRVAPASSFGARPCTTASASRARDTIARAATRPAIR
ncbi:MAG: hypothetical protein ABSH51_02185 [Solirubrobacteraceae bacterium]